MSDGCGDRDKAFIEMLRAFRRSGGLTRDVDALHLARMGDRLRTQEGGVGPICFEWGGSLWMPRFQFDLADMSMRQGPAKIISELEGVFDGWEMATWFARPNVWIGDSTPVDMLDRCFDSALGAARADRFIAAG